MDDSRVEQIEAAVFTRLAAIATPTYNYDYMEVSRRLRRPEDINSHPCLFCPGGYESGTQEVANAERELHLPIWGVHNLHDEPGTQLNKMRQDVEVALFGDVTGSILGLEFIMEADVAEVDKWQSVEDDQEVLRMVIRFKFTYDRGDP